MSTPQPTKSQDSTADMAKKPKFPLKSPKLPPKPTKQINLLRGWPSPNLLPTVQLSDASTATLWSHEVAVPALQYGPDPGHWPLRVGLARWLTKFYYKSTKSLVESNGGVEADPERICITGGASQSIANILASYSDPNFTRAVWMGAPCYYLACPIFEDAGFAGRMRAVPEDDEGVDVELLEEKLLALEESERGTPFRDPFKNPGKTRKLYRHIIYIVPTSSNPSGKTLPLPRRRALLALAKRHNALIISDDVYDFLQWPLSPSTTPIAPVPRMCDLERTMSIDELTRTGGGFGNAVSNGSFSKLAGPGLRTGWVEGSANFIYGLSRTGGTRSGGAPSQFCAAILGYLVENGELEAHVDEVVRPALQRRHAVMMEAVGMYLGPLGVRVSSTSSVRGANVYGGYFIWVTLTEGLPAVCVAKRAAEEENLILGNGDMFEVLGDESSATFEMNLRLCFSWEAEDDLVEGVRRLGRLLQRIKDDRTYYDMRCTGAHRKCLVDFSK